MIKTPVLSAVANKCSFASAANKDQILRAAIDYVDRKDGATKPAECNEADIAIIAEARGVEYVTGQDLIAYVPVYSNQIPAAKEFLKFMASDEGMRIFRDGTSGCELPLTYTNKQAATKVTGFRQSINSILDVSTARFVNGKDKIFALGGVNVLLHDNSYGRFADAFSNGKTAAQYFEAEVDAVNSSIDQAKQQANIK
jgi:ABC-type glycerol-3-phosphate transport system substrate-binding protein